MPNDNRLQILVYVDDLLASLRHQNLRVVERKLQDSINIVEIFAQKNGFKLHKQNVNVTIYQTVNPPLIELRLGKIRIEKSEAAKHLGLVFDSKLNRKVNIHQFKSKCNKALNLMRSVSLTNGEQTKRP